MSSSTVVSSRTSKSRSMLLSLLDQGSDVVLVFTANFDGTTQEVPAHSLVLGQWSEVLRGALRAECGAGASCCSCCGGKTSSSIPKIPMDGTEKDDWLLAMEFVYPVVPQPEVTWDTVECLLLLGDKYGMPALMERVSTFVKQHVGELRMERLSQCYVWKWISMLDRYGLSIVAKACINGPVDVLRLMDACPKTQLSELSSDTLQHLVLAMDGALARPNVIYCPKCRKVVKKAARSGFSGLYCPTCNRDL